MLVAVGHSPNLRVLLSVDLLLVAVGHSPNLPSAPTARRLARAADFG